MKATKIIQQSFLLFSPFLIGLLTYVYFEGTNEWYADGIRYVEHSRSLLEGFYSPHVKDINLVNGPGYPIILMFFLGLRLPLVCIGIFNAFLFYFSIILIHKILQKLVPIRLATLASIFLACYINAYREIPWIQCETLALFLMSLIIFFTVKAFNTKSYYGTKKYIFLSGFFIGYLVLTKALFGYVLLFMLAGGLFMWICDRKSVNHSKGVVILLIALAINIPYLVYTFHVTGKMFYWSSAGGDSFYWMTTPHKGEYGDWIDYKMLLKDSTLYTRYSPDNEESLILNHKEDFREILKLKGVAQDDLFKKIAINNIKLHPYKYILNCICNAGRIFFNFPYTHTLQKPQQLLRLPFSGIIAVFILIIFIPTVINWKKIDYSVRFMLFFAFLYLSGSLLVTAENRMLTAIVPILLLWITFLIEKMVNIKIRF